MRDQGRLVQWFDDQGYGFIQPNDPDKGRVFLHIKDFSRPGPRPIVGCALEYQVILDEQGRYRARQVSYLKAAQAQKMSRQATQQSPIKPQGKLQPMQMGIALYLLSLGVLTLSGSLSGVVLLLIILMNALSYWMYAQDKEAARQGSRRIPEQTLHVLSSLGGWPAAWWAQQKLRHKTQKQPFRQLYFATIALNLLLLGWLVSPLNVFHL